ncbi:helix-turn-helix domain-containing protein [Exiguobacterium sp. AB2]|uniref:helix-turn-helix domain-containing protein n=1 Tax=Exiguobacterium sp. AB2 TaxID=1484479 RepID=UPI00068A5780|nr:helix-turn-helix transcriptional regulator [Exiguobacterium sp. AB2]
MVDTTIMETFNGSRGSETDMTTIGKRAFARRKDLGLTQKFIAEQLKVSPNTYSNYESDKRKIEADMIPKLAKLLKTTTSYLLGESDDPEETKFEAAMRFSDMEIKILRTLNLSDDDTKNLTDEQIREIRAFIEFQISRHRERK